MATLLRAAGASVGSKVVRTAELEFCRKNAEDSKVVEDVERSRRYALLAEAGSELTAWVEAERTQLREVRTLVDRAIALEKERGEVLLDELPELWRALHVLAEAGLTQYETALLEVSPMVEQWEREIPTSMAKEACIAIGEQVMASPRALHVCACC